MANLSRHNENSLVNYFDGETGRLWDLFPGFEEGLVSTFTPAVEITENENEYKVKAEVPGIKKEDIKVRVENNILKIEGKREERKTEKGECCHRIEHSYGSFCRTLQLPEDIDSAGIKAGCKDGVLELTIPRSQKKKPKEIEIEYR